MWYAIIKGRMFFGGWIFRGNNAPLEKWVSLPLAAKKFHASSRERIDELHKLANRLNGKLLMIPDLPVKGNTNVEKCEQCQQYKPSAIPRPDLGRRVLCADCHAEAMRGNRPSALVTVPTYLRAGAQ
jgi:hypothetical protein